MAEARTLAQELRVQIEAQTVKDMAELEKKIEQQIASERQVAITQMRAVAARVAIKLTEQILPDLLTANVKSKLLGQFIEQLDSVNANSSKVAGPSLESINR